MKLQQPRCNARQTQYWKSTMRLARHPSVSTPAKPSEERKHKRVELEDSDTDATSVIDEEAKDATTGCSSRKIKKIRYIIDDSVSD
ncbi:hypothetical protein Tco_0575958 [Tanacetum coccineum]